MPKNQKLTPTRVRGIWRNAEGGYVAIQWRQDPKTGERTKRQRTVSSFRDAVAAKEQLACEDLPTSRPSRMKFIEFAGCWLEEHTAALAPSTAERYRTAVLKMAVYFEKHWLDAIDDRDVRAMQQWAKDLGFRAATINGWHRILRLMLDGSGVEPNPARKVKTLREPRTGGRRGTSLGLSDFRTFLQTLRALAEQGQVAPDLARLLELIAWTGCRRGEALALKWADWTGDVLTISRSVWKRGEKATKTEDQRAAHVHEVLAELLRGQRRWLLDIQHPGLASDLMFPADPRHARAGANRRGVDEMSWFRSGSALDKPLALIVAAGGLPKISNHSLRRTFENLHRRAGTDQLTRQAMAGWASSDAQGIYADCDREELREASQRHLRMIMGGGEGQTSAINTRDQHPGVEPRSATK